MAYGAGIGASFGIKTESTFNPAASGVTVDHFTEMNSESLKFNKNTAVGSGLRAGGKVQRSQRRVVTTTDASGDLDIDLPTRGLGLYLAHAMGTFPSPVTVSSGVYSYSFTLGDTSATSFSTQATVPQYGGALTTKTLTGCKIGSFELSVSAGEIAKAKFSIDAAGFSTATTPSTYAYPANGSVFHFAQGAITIDGASVANIKDFSISVDNSLKNDRYNLGSAGIKSQQVINGFRAITGKITAEFTDTVLLAKFLADTSAAIVLTFTGDTISSTFKDTLRITIPAAKFDADTPNVDGPGVVDVGFSFTAFDNGTDEPMTVFYQTADSAL